tara:strand:- start:577 stop:996 length:420 start_codon:yes stop_codon:yes gene_type:complete
MSQLNVLHRVQLNVGSIPLSFSHSALSADTTTGFSIGTQRVGATAEFIGGDASNFSRAEITATARNCLMLIRNDTAASTADADQLLVCLDSTVGSPLFNVVIKPQFVNLISIEDFAKIKIKSGGNNVDYTFAVVQIDAE